MNTDVVSEPTPTLAFKRTHPDRDLPRSGRLRPKVVIGHPMLGFGGSESVVMWLIEALKKSLRCDCCDDLRMGSSSTQRVLWNTGSRERDQSADCFSPLAPARIAQSLLCEARPINDSRAALPVNTT
jgi:hypothetical protein